jgi:hydroxypyruvate isomerase
MATLAANLTMLFTELPFLERFAAARATGFKYVEFLFPYDHAPEQIRQLLDANGLTLVLHNLPAGDWGAGERGIAADPARTAEFQAGVAEAIRYATALGAPRLNCLAGKANADFSPDAHWQTLVANVRFAGQALAEAGLKLLVEPVNHFDIPGFVLNTTAQGARLLEEVGLDNVYLQFDIYHVQREEGNITPSLRQHFTRIDHVQLADNPGRHQPGTGEINYPYLLAELDRLGYQGYVGCEYIPSPTTADSLSWIREMGCRLA